MGMWGCGDEGPRRVSQHKDPPTSQGHPQRAVFALPRTRRLRAGARAARPTREVNFAASLAVVRDVADPPGTLGRCQGPYVSAGAKRRAPLPPAGLDQRGCNAWGGLGHAVGIRAPRRPLPHHRRWTIEIGRDRDVDRSGTDGVRSHVRKWGIRSGIGHMR